ncbi:MAG: alpha/beta fold hydrolase [Myxococcota bacterium]
MQTRRLFTTLTLTAALAACSGDEPTGAADETTTGDDTETAEAVSDCVTPESAAFERPFAVDAEQYPFDDCAFETAAGTLHYVDAGPKDAEHTVLMVHGNPTWSFLYRNISQDLLEDGYRVVIPDHIGMGMSDVPSTADFDYRPRSHAAHLQALVEALDLEDVTLVVQDWGGPIGLDLATKQPERIGRILIMNTWAWSVDIDDPGYAHQMVRWYEQVQMAEQVPDLFCRFMLPGQAAENALQADPSEGTLYDAVLSAYISPHIVPETGDYRYAEPCAPMQIFAESIFDDNAFQAEIEARMTALRGTPYALLFGLSDILFGAQRCDMIGEVACPGTTTCACDPELLPDRVDADCATASEEYFVCVDEDGAALEPFADRFVELLGEDTLVARETVPTSDHMVQEGAPEQVVAAIRQLIAETQ